MQQRPCWAMNSLLDSAPCTVTCGLLPAWSPQTVLRCHRLRGGWAAGNKASAGDSRADRAFLWHFWGWSDHSRRRQGALIYLSLLASMEGTGSPRAPRFTLGGVTPPPPPGHFASLSPCRPPAPAFPFGKSETLGSPVVGSFSRNYEQTSSFESSQETDRICSWIGFNVRNENKSLGVRRTRRPVHSALSPGPPCLPGARSHGQRG